MSPAGNRLRGRLGLALRYGVTLALMAWIIRSGDWHRMRAVLEAVRPRDFALSYLLLLAAWAVVIARLQVLLAWTPIRRTWLRLYRIQLISHFIGFVAPSDVGMAVARWFMVTQNRTGRGAFLLVTLQERLLLMAMAALLCLPALLTSNATLPPHVTGRLAVLLLVVLAGSLGTLAVLSRGVSSGWGRRWVHRLARIVGLGSSMQGEEEARGGVEVAWGRVLGRAALLTVVFLAISVLNAGVLACSLGVRIAGRDLLWMVMCTMLLLTLPFSIGGIGLRELGYGTLFHWVGADTAAGVALGLLLSAQILLNALLGGILSLGYERTAHPPEAAHPGREGVDAGS